MDIKKNFVTSHNNYPPIVVNGEIVEIVNGEVLFDERDTYYPVYFHNRKSYGFLCCEETLDSDGLFMNVFLINNIPDYEESEHRTITSFRMKKIMDFIADATKSQIV